jgi:hypothetical protein
MFMAWCLVKLRDNFAFLTAISRKLIASVSWFMVRDYEGDLAAESHNHNTQL